MTAPLAGLAASAASPRLAVAADRFLASPDSPAVRWTIWPGLTAYADAVAFMDEHVAAIAAGLAPETVLLLEHPSLYTAGTSADAADLVDPDRFPVHASGRGGEYTYHGPGQRVAYVMLDLKRRRPDVRAFVSALEHWIIATLGDFQVRGERREDRVGVWVRRPDRPAGPGGSMAEDKIAAIGIRLRKWVTLHGISLNVDPDLDHFGGIVPCGVSDHGVTSLVDLGLPVSMPDVDLVLRQHFEEIFGPTEDAAAGDQRD
ncbi:lipoyl(octanoyl) transferase LipB [Aureimonas glaciei]|uniref:lipoyl(octanoyl) transferase LipB n=1 Tax=Aureimonas glaciei TaxID=1776957 RepID=UPI00166E2429